MNDATAADCPCLKRNYRMIQPPCPACLGTGYDLAKPIDEAWVRDVLGWAMRVDQEPDLGAIRTYTAPSRVGDNQIEIGVFDAIGRSVAAIQVYLNCDDMPGVKSRCDLLALVRLATGTEIYAGETHDPL